MAERSAWSSTGVRCLAAPAVTAAALLSATQVHAQVLVLTAVDEPNVEERITGVTVNNNEVPVRAGKNVTIESRAAKNGLWQIEVTMQRVLRKNGQEIFRSPQTYVFLVDVRQLGERRDLRLSRDRYSACNVDAVAGVEQHTPDGSPFVTSVRLLVNIQDLARVCPAGDDRRLGKVECKIYYSFSRNSNARWLLPQRELPSQVQQCTRWDSQPYRPL